MTAAPFDRLLACAVVAHVGVLAFMLGDSDAALIAGTAVVALATLVAARLAPGWALLVPLSLAVLWLPLATLDDSLPATDPGSGAGEGLVAVFMVGELLVALAAWLIGAFWAALAWTERDG